MIGLLSIVAITLSFYWIMRNALVQRTIDQLSSVNVLKRAQIDGYFDRSRKDFLFLFTHDFFLDHFDPATDGASLSIENFPRSVASEIAAIRSLYAVSNITVANHDWVEVFSVVHDDIAMDTVLRQLNWQTDRKSFYTIDASSFSSTGETILLYVIPVFLHRDDEAFYIVVHEDFGKIQTLLGETAGMGSTGESYLIGDDYKMRSRSRFFPQRAPMSIEVKTYDLQHVPVDSAGNHILTDYRGEEVISFCRPLQNAELPWYIISEMDLSEAMAPVDQLRNYLLIVTAVIMFAILAFTVLISNAISRPIVYLRSVIMTLSKGIIPSQKIEVNKIEEIDQITSAVGQLIGGMKRTTDFAYSIGKGDFNTPYTALSNEDSLGAALIHMRDQLRTLNETEIRLVREKASALLEGQENERKRIIRELHDGVGQLLTAVRLQIELLEGHGDKVEEIKSLINETIDEVRRISYNVMPNALVDFGLEAALKGLCENVNRYAGLVIDFRYVKEVERRLDFDISIAVFRIVQEGFNNVIKHASAHHVDLHVVDREDEIFVLLRDDGVGFDEEKVRAKNGFGLRSMRERAMLLNGDVDIQPEAGGGTIIELHIPVTSK